MLRAFIYHANTRTMRAKRAQSGGKRFMGKRCADAGRINILLFIPPSLIWPFVDSSRWITTQTATADSLERPREFRLPASFPSIWRRPGEPLQRLPRSGFYAASLSASLLASLSATQRLSCFLSISISLSLPLSLPPPPPSLSLSLPLSLSLSLPLSLFLPPPSLSPLPLSPPCVSHPYCTDARE
jgi:hypothetical protein